MSSHDIRSAQRPDPDRPMVDIANYVADYTIDSTEAYDTARYMLLDSLACAMLAMKFPECVKHLGPLVPGAVLLGGAKVPGTAWELDPVQAAYNIGVLVRWLDFNDTWLAAEWGHPSDNLGAILAVADYLSRKAEREGGKPLTVRDVLGYAIKAHEIQGCYALKNSFNRVGLDHVILVRLASTAVATHMLGGSKILNRQPQRAEHRQLRFCGAPRSPAGQQLPELSRAFRAFDRPRPKGLAVIARLGLERLTPIGEENGLCNRGRVDLAVDRAAGANSVYMRAWAKPPARDDRCRRAGGGDDDVGHANRCFGALGGLDGEVAAL